jgi:hypothetical protein
MGWTCQSMIQRRTGKAYTQHAMAQQIPTMAIATVAWSSALLYIAYSGLAHLPDFRDKEG